MTAAGETAEIPEWAPFVILLAALAVRLVGVNAESFTMDEITELGFVHLPLMKLVPLADGFPPLYQLALKSWLGVFASPLAARWLSALLGVVTVHAVYQLARDVGGPRAALAAGILTALSPMQVWFAQESRAYALALPLAACTLWRFWRATTTNTRRGWLLYAASAVATICTHYFAAIVVALQALWHLPALVRPERDRRPALLASGILTVAAVPVLLLVRADLAFQSGTGSGTIGLGEIFYTPHVFLLGFSTGLSLRDLHQVGVREAARAFLPWVAAVTCCLAPAVIAWLRRPGARSSAVGYLLLMTVGPVMTTLVLAGAFGLKFKVSYVSWASIPVVVLLGTALAATWSRWSVRIGAAVYVALMLVALANRHLDDRYRNEDARSLATYLQSHSSPDTPVLVIAGYMTDPIEFYLGRKWTVRDLPDGAPALDALAAMHRPAWIAYTRPFHGDPRGDVRRGLAARPDARLASTFAGIDLYRLEPDAPSPEES